MANLEINHSIEKDIHIVQLTGNVRPDTCEPFRNMIETILPTCKHLVIELNNVKDFTTIGITILTEIASYFEINKGTLQIVTTDELHIETFEICDLTPTYFKVYPSYQEAISSFGG